MTVTMETIRDWVGTQEAYIEAALQELVEINTYTANRVGVDDGMDAISTRAEDLGFIVQAIHGRHRLIKGGNGNGKPRILLVAHMDTVHPPDSGFSSYEPLPGGFVRGPGVGDIKGGLIIGLWSMIGLREMIGDNFDVQLIISADEEIGSPTIRDWYMKGHVGAQYAIGLEPGFPQGALTPDVPLGVVYQRRGYGVYSFSVYGVGAHSGTAHLGINAIEAAAQRIVKIHALGDEAQGTSTTVGMIHGGTAANTVPDCVEATASWRFERLADGELIRDAIKDIFDETVITNEGLGKFDHVEYSLDAFIPPMERSDENQKVIDIVLEESKRLGQNVVPIARGGGADTNWISRGGTPSICGMGAPSRDIHTEDETIYLPGLFDRVALLSSTLYRMMQ